ncbi:MAG: hypothetical protein IIB35_09955 [Gemmatimonadetes bacterium]|nr:hypothetical protein [Gemmatimonadota bacterium]
MRFWVHAAAISVLTVVFALATLAFGWWIVFVVGMIWAAVVRRTDRPLRAVVGAAPAAWIGVLLLTGSGGPVGQLADLFGVVLPLPRILLYVPTLATAGALAMGGALLMGVLRSGEEWTGEERRKPGVEEIGSA